MFTKHNHTIYVLSLVLLMISVPLLVQCSAIVPAISPTNNVIHVGVIAPMSGNYASTGKAVTQAVQLATKEVNDVGGLMVDGKTYTVKLFFGDDKKDPEVGKQIAHTLIENDRVVALVGLPSSNVAIPVATIAETAHIPMISSASTNPQTTAGKTFVFRTAYNDTFQGSVLAQFAHTELKAHTVAIFYDETIAYNSFLAQTFAETFRVFSDTTVISVTYAGKQTDWQPYLAPLQQQQPDVVFLPNYNVDLVPQVQTIHTLGITATLLGSDTWNYIPEEYCEEMDGSLFTAHWSPNIANERALIFIDSYYNAYNEIPGESAALAYDSMGLLFQAIMNQNGFDALSIQQGLHNIEQFYGVTGTITYHGKQDPERSVVILQYHGKTTSLYRQVNP